MFCLVQKDPYEAELDPSAGPVGQQIMKKGSSLFRSKRSQAVDAVPSSQTTDKKVSLE